MQAEEMPNSLMIPDYYSMPLKYVDTSHQHVASTSFRSIKNQ